VKVGYGINSDIYKTAGQVEFKLLQRGRRQTDEQTDRQTDCRYYETNSIKRDYESFLKIKYLLT
jgi:hypothetical protein